jgi:topoisomerase-4 subunit A
MPGPDYPGGGQIISSGRHPRRLRERRGSLKVRARWKIEDLARGQWQLVVTELPPGVSAQKVLEEIEELTNPKVKTGKKALTQEQTQLKARCWRCSTGARRVEQGRAGAPGVRAQEPHIEQQELANTLLAHTSLETSSPINLTMIGLDGRPVQKSLRQMLEEWIAFQQTITRRSQHRLAKVLDRIHILEGRQLVLLNIDEVIAIIRQRRAQGGADRALQPQRPPGRGHPRDPPAPAGAAGGHQDRAGAGELRDEQGSWKTSWAARPRCAA